MSSPTQQGESVSLARKFFLSADFPALQMQRNKIEFRGTPTAKQILAEEINLRR
jgi:hypothetical protein